MGMTGKTPKTGHTWLAFLEEHVDAITAASTNSAGVWKADLVASSALPACTYANGTAGVGATLTGTSNGALGTIDGVTTAYGMIILVAGQSSASQNGLYYVTRAGSAGTTFLLTRLSGQDQSALLLAGTVIYIRKGTANAGLVWVYSGPSSPVMGTTSLTFASLAAGSSGRVTNANMRGVIPSGRVAFSVNPTANDTLAIGGKTFKFVASLGAAVAQVQVLIGGSAAATLASTVKAINGTSAPAEWTEATSAFATPVVADAVTATSLRIRNAVSRGGAALPGVSGSVALTASVTGGASAWTVANLNESGKAPTDNKTAVGSWTVSAADITAGHIWVEFDFTPTLFMAQAFSSSGVQRAYSDVTAISGNALHITLGGGASPNLQANDVLTFKVWQ